MLISQNLERKLWYSICWLVELRRSHGTCRTLTSDDDLGKFAGLLGSFGGEKKLNGMAEWCVERFSED